MNDSFSNLRIHEAYVSCSFSSVSDWVSGVNPVAQYGTILYRMGEPKHCLVVK